MCVNALGGLFSFLRQSISRCSPTGRRCQCPRRALLISTKWIMRNFALTDGCVNALGGLFSFLHSTFSPCAQKEGCVNALGGLFSFLRRICFFGWIPIRRGVNALGGLFSFLQTGGERRPYAQENCVNALGGLFSFLRQVELTTGALYEQCQCPRRALLISTQSETC